MNEIYILCLANMHGGVDKSVPVAVFDNIEKLKSFYNNQLADTPWKDDRWHKVFKKDSILEWYNPLSPINQSGDDIFKQVSWHDAAFGGVMQDVIGKVPEASDFNIPFNPQ